LPPARRRSGDRQSDFKRRLSKKKTESLLQAFYDCESEKVLRFAEAKSSPPQKKKKPREKESGT
jgi:hypothetical protein